MANQGRIAKRAFINKPAKGYVHLRIDPNNNNLVAFHENGEESIYVASFLAFAFTAFNISVGTQVIGAVVNDVSLSWECNKEITAQSGSFTNGELPPETRRLVLENQNITRDTGFSLSAVHEGESANAGAGIHFANYRFWGFGPAGITSPNDLTEISGSDLTDSKSAQITVNAPVGQKIYFIRPARFGAGKYNVGGFEGGFDESVHEWANEYGFKEDYIFGESTNDGLGKTTVTIS